MSLSAITRHIRQSAASCPGELCVEQHHSPGGADIGTNRSHEQEINYKSILRKRTEIQIEQE